MFETVAPQAASVLSRNTKSAADAFVALSARKILTEYCEHE
jgi:hypothetical protein